MIISSTPENAILFRLSAADKIGMLKICVDAFLAESLNILSAQTETRIEQTVTEFISNDNTSEQGFGSLLKVCRKLQSLDGCNHLFAEFVRLASMAGKPLLTHSGVTPFESYFSGQLLNGKEPLHPDNADALDIEPAIYELDKAAAEFISEPDRLLVVKPSDMEKIIAEVYRAHGFDVKVTGGPKDHGIDAIAIAYIPMDLPRKFSQYLRVAIQVKRYQRAHKVGESELRNLYGSLTAEGYDRGILVTTSSLTASAAQYLETRRAVKDRITVVAGDEVLELLISYCKQKWIPFWR